MSYILLAENGQVKLTIIQDDNRPNAVQENNYQSTTLKPCLPKYYIIMFTVDDIKTAHDKVKSGAYFPHYT